MLGWSKTYTGRRRLNMAEGDSPGEGAPEGGGGEEAMAPTPEETGAIATAVATGIIKLVEDAAESIEITEEDRMDMEALVEALIEVALAVEEGADPGMAGEAVTEFLETNPEIADAAGAIGAALLDQAEGGGEEAPEEPPAESAESSAES